MGLPAEVQFHEQRESFLYSLLSPKLQRRGLQNLLSVEALAGTQETRFLAQCARNGIVFSFPKSKAAFLYQIPSARNDDKREL